MKKLILPILCAAMLLSSCASYTTVETSLPLGAASPSLSVTSVGEMTEEVRGAWIATAWNINFPSAPDLPESALRSELDAIVETARSLGLNALYFQVHPSSDAMYRSSLFPVSRYLSTDGGLYFDPLEYLIDICHRDNIAVHAWVNPLRVTVDKASSRDDALAGLDPLIAPELTVYHPDGKLYFDPGLPEVRELIADCVGEIVSGYDVDGVIFDDYFYPSATDGRDFDDDASYTKYGNGAKKDDWRRENVNLMIRGCYERIKSIRADCLFGVAPCGIWRNDDGQNGGSATRGMEGYSQIYCDALAWAKGGYVDYLSPQIYWEFENTAAPFGELCEWWNRQLDGTGVGFVPSLAAYRYDGDWDSPAGEITSQIAFGRKMISYRGAIYYGFASIRENSVGIADEIVKVNSDGYYYTSPVDIPYALEVFSPITGIVTDENTVTLSGRSDPKLPLTVNGVVVSRRVGGCFEAEYSLSDGENVITVKCGDSEKTLHIYKR